MQSNGHLSLLVGSKKMPIGNSVVFKSLWEIELSKFSTISASDIVHTLSTPQNHIFFHLCDKTN